MNNQLQIFKNEKLNLKVEAIQNKDGSISISAEDTAIGFGWFDNSKSATSGAQLLKVRWARMNKYISELNFSQHVGKGDFIPESLFYLLAMKANNKVAQEFQKWLAVEVIPAIRKNGAYMTELKGQEKMFQLLRNEVNGIVNEIVSLKVKEIEEKCSDYYRPTHFDKTNISSYIKKRLGITKANDEYELVKQRVLLRLGANKWEDIPVEELRESLNIIDESIRIVKLDRPIQQVSFF